MDPTPSPAEMDPLPGGGGRTESQSTQKKFAIPMHAPWEALPDDVEGGTVLPPPLSLKELFASRPDDVLRTLQSQGVTKLGEFKAKSALVYAAFGGSTLLTLGNDQRAISYETVWRRELRSRAGHISRTGWEDEVILESYVINVAEAADPDKDGLIQPLLRRWQAGACPLTVFGLPVIQGTINFKWSAFARRLLLWELAFFLLWIAAFFGFTFLFQDEDLTMSLSQLASTPRGAATLGLEALAFVAMAPFLVLEAGTLTAYGIWGWANVWNCLDLCTYTIQLWVTVAHVGRLDLKGNTLSVLLALQCIFLLFRLQYFSRVFKTTRFSFLEAIRDVLYEIKFYFVFLLMIMFGFASAFHILFRRDQAVSNFDTLGHALIKIYSSQGGLDYQEMLASHVPGAATALNVVYSFVMGMVLVNLLIGIMSNALEKVTQHEALKLLLHKAQIIDELESTLPRWLENEFEKEWYPRHIHVLRIDPDRVERVDLGALWQQEGGGEKEKSEGGGGDLSARLDAIQATLDALTVAVARGAVTPAVSASLGHPATPALDAEA